MATYFHVTTTAYNTGEDLLSWDAYIARYGEAPCAWKWDEAEEGFDGHLISLLREDQASEIADVAAYIDGPALVLTIETDEAWEQELGFDVNSEGYTVALHRIPAEVITNVASI